MKARWAAAALMCWLVGSGQTQQPIPLPPQQPQPPGAKLQPRLEAIAETKLIMEGLAQPNMRGLGRLLNQQPKDVQSWTFARGQALLLAETANLLMLRPPKNAGEPIWFQRTMEFRSLSVQLAQAVGTKDYDRSKTLMVSLANACNRCHQTFRVPVEITPFEEQPLPKVGL